MQKTLYIAIAGAPNAGKSTLLNTLIGQKIAIVTPKVQTTRSILRGIIIYENAQLIFIDTPGLFIPHSDRTLERSIVKAAYSGISDADYVILLIDSASNKTITDDIIQNIKSKNITAIITKTDITKKNKVIEIEEDLKKLAKFEKILKISSHNNEGIEELKKFLASKAIASPWPYNEDEITDAPMRFLAAEITRETIFYNLREELPYNIAVETEMWEEKEEKIIIHQVIYLTKDSHKNIFIGKGGQMIKKIGIESKEKIKELTQNNNVDLFLFAKVRPNWMDNKDLLN